MLFSLLFYCVNISEDGHWSICYVKSRFTVDCYTSDRVPNLSSRQQSRKSSNGAQLLSSCSDVYVVPSIGVWDNWLLHFSNRCFITRCAAWINKAAVQLLPWSLMLLSVSLLVCEKSLEVLKTSSCWVCSMALSKTNDVSKGERHNRVWCNVTLCKLQLFKLIFFVWFLLRVTALLPLSS